MAIFANIGLLAVYVIFSLQIIGASRTKPFQLTRAAIGDYHRRYSSSKHVGVTRSPETDKNTWTRQEEVCFESLGCFSMRPPWRSVHRPVPAPWPPEDIDTRFSLCTRKQQQCVPIHPVKNLSEESTELDSEKRTFIIVHDIATNSSTTWVTNLKNALLEKVGGNVILVDWAHGSKGSLSYLQVISNARIVGAEIARLLKELTTHHKMNFEDLHLFGLGVGAHTAAYAGNRINEVGRLTALDPAQAAFQEFEHTVRVDSEDAIFVDVVHTDARPSVPFLGAGMALAVGDIDFYINGGVDQPGCPFPENLPRVKSINDFSKISSELYYKVSSCQHERAAVLFTESIRFPSCTFWGQPGLMVEADPEDVEAGRPFSYLSSLFEDCTVQNCAPLGLNAIKYPARDSLVVTTDKRSPYCVKDPELDETMQHDMKKFQLNMSKNPFVALNKTTTIQPSSTSSTSSTNIPSYPIHKATEWTGFPLLSAHTRSTSSGRTSPIQSSALKTSPTSSTSIPSPKSSFLMHSSSPQTPSMTSTTILLHKLTSSIPPSTRETLPVSTSSSMTTFSSGTPIHGKVISPIATTMLSSSNSPLHSSSHYFRLSNVMKIPSLPRMFLEESTSFSPIVLNVSSVNDSSSVQSISSDGKTQTTTVANLPQTRHPSTPPVPLPPLPLPPPTELSLPNTP